MIEGKNTIVLLNKSDLTPSVTEENIRFVTSKILKPENRFDTENIKLSDKKISNINKIIKTSMKEKEGIELFLQTVKEMFFHGDITFNDEVYITNARHKEALQDAFDSLVQVKKSIEDQMPEDFYTIDLMSAYEKLGLIIGESVEDDLVNEIFSKFCMGK